MNEQQEQVILAGLKSLAATARGASASPGVEAAVLAEMARVLRPAPINRAWLPLAAALVVASISGAWVARSLPPSRSAQLHPSGFVAVPGAGGLPPMESGAIVRVALQISALPSYGIQLVPDMSTDSVEADLLVAQDGVTRAIRLVNDSTTSRSTP